MISRSNSETKNPQRLQQWAIINKQRAIENKYMRQMQRLQQYNKKIKFKHDLDLQLENKTNMNQIQQRNDKQYLQYILKKGLQQKQKEQQQKRQRIEKRRRIQQENLLALNQLKNSKNRSMQPQYTLDIGIKSQILHKQKQKKGLQDMKDTLDIQIREKNQQLNRVKSIQLRNSSNTSLINKQSINPALAKNYGQSLNTYKTYEKILNERKRQEQELYKRITQQAAYKIQRENRQRLQNEKRRKQQLTSQMIYTLDNQLKQKSRQKSQQKQVNPQQISFNCFSQLYRQKPPTYDKNKYYQQLRRQAEQQRQRKKNSKYMNEQEYKINMNQLNKIVSGGYTYNQYIDRTLDNIGALPLKQQPYQYYGQNSEIIKSQLQKIKRQRSNFYSRMENSFS